MTPRPMTCAGAENTPAGKSGLGITTTFRSVSASCCPTFKSLAATTTRAGSPLPSMDARTTLTIFRVATVATTSAITPITISRFRFIPPPSCSIKIAKLRLRQQWERRRQSHIGKYGQKSWRVSVSDRHDGRRNRNTAVGDQCALRDCDVGGGERDPVLTGIVDHLGDNPPCVSHIFLLHRKPRPFSGRVIQNLVGPNDARSLQHQHEHENKQWHDQGQLREHGSAFPRAALNWSHCASPTGRSR